MSFNNNTIGTTRSPLETIRLGRIEPLGDAAAPRRDKRRQRRGKSQAEETDEHVDPTVYTPAGQVTGDEHGKRVRLSA